jgi:hypothetical protein
MADTEHVNDGLNDTLLKTVDAEARGRGRTPLAAAVDDAATAGERAKSEDASSAHGAGGGSDAGSTASGTPSANGTGTGAARIATQPKKFSASNINQQWRQKTSAPPATTHNAPHPVAVKSSTSSIGTPSLEPRFDFFVVNLPPFS